MKACRSCRLLFIEQWRAACPKCGKSIIVAEKWQRDQYKAYNPPLPLPPKQRIEFAE